MEKECEKHHMKPVCGHQSYCKTNPKTVFIGQTNQLSVKTQRTAFTEWPNGWTTSQANRWSTTHCAWSNANGNSALCGTSTTAHSWQPWSANKWFMCGADYFHPSFDVLTGDLATPARAPVSIIIIYIYTSSSHHLGCPLAGDCCVIVVCIAEGSPCAHPWWQYDTGCTVPVMHGKTQASPNANTLQLTSPVPPPGPAPTPAAPWSPLVTISNCGGSAADNVCGAGTITKKEATGWSNRVWDTKECCHNCACTGARWKVPASSTGMHLYCGFSAWNAAGSTNKDGDYKFATYSLDQPSNNRLYHGQNGPDGSWMSAPIIGNNGITSGTAAYYTNVDRTKYYEVHLTSTGADLKFNGNKIHTIALAPTDTKYRFGCAIKQTNAGITDLAYFGDEWAPTLAPIPTNLASFPVGPNPDARRCYNDVTQAKTADRVPETMEAGVGGPADGPGYGRGNHLENKV